jgi:hypothetical protein
MAKILNHTINSGIVKDVLVELAERDMHDRYLGGGMSLQFFLPVNFHRLTTDLDLESPIKKPFTEFKYDLTNILYNLSQRGYNVTFSKEGSTYDCLLERDNYLLALQMPRRGLKRHEELKPRLEKEFANSKIIPYGKGRLRVINVNDIIARKILRIKVFHEEYGLAVPTDIEAERGVETANILKESLYKESLDGNPQEIAKQIAHVRLLSDVSDIKAIIDNIPKEIDPRSIRESLVLSNPRNFEGLEKLLDSLGLPARIESNAPTEIFYS